MLIFFKYYIENMSELNALKFDLDTVTVGDWSVELDISDEQYQTFKKQCEQNEKDFKGKDLVYEKMIIENEIEHIKKELENESESDDDKTNKNIKRLDKQMKKLASIDDYKK